jgi:hypothetical protein
MKRALFYAKSEDGNLVFSNKRQMAEFLHMNKNKEFEVYIKRITHMRTGVQNNSIHLGLQLLADGLNAAGLDMKKVLKQEVDIPWTMDSCKTFLFKPIMKALYGKESTTELDKVGEIDEVWDTMMRFLAQKFNFEHIPFPSEDNNPNQ